MKNKLLIIGLLILSSCELIDQNHFDIEKELEPYVESFYVESIRRGRTIQRENLMMYFKPLKGLMGESMNFTAIPTIHIDRSIFDKYVKEKRTLYIEYVVFHELGHALLYRDHEDSYTIMTSNNKMINAYSYSEQARRLLIDELFGAKETDMKLLATDQNTQVFQQQDCDSHSRTVL